MNCHLPGKRSKKPANCFFALIILAEIRLFNENLAIYCLCARGAKDILQRKRQWFVHCPILEKYMIAYNCTSGSVGSVEVFAVSDIAYAGKCLLSCPDA